MSFPAYPAYKDSGVPWLGDVPAHWELSRIGSRFTERREKVSDTDFPPLSVTKNGIVPQLETAAKTDDNDNRKGVRAGDFVINSRSDRKGSSGLSSLDGSVSLINTVIRPDDTMHGAFVHHLLRSVAFQEEYYRYGKGIVADLWSTNYGEMKAITLAVPPIDEQVTIAAFLDRETAKIDVLVAEQERLIALLKEKRQAVISHAVTKGLNPHAPMKDSGIEWLGEVPAHWDIAPLRRVVSQFVDYRGVTPTKVDEGVPLITASQIKNGRVDHSLDPVFITEEEYETRMTRGFPARGDLLLTTEAPLGEAALIEEERVSPGQRIILMKVDTALYVSTYLLAHFRSLFGQSELLTRASGSTASGIRSDRLRASNVLVPPLVEQLAIVKHVNDVTRSFDDVIEEANGAIALLQERRAALISAAATGKIDVRGQVSLSNVVALESARPARARPALSAIVGTYAIRELGPMGRMAVMKAGYLAEAYAGLSGLNGRYERYAAGPYDRVLLSAMERGANEFSGIITHEPRSAGDAVTYQVPSTATGPFDALRIAVGEEAAECFRSMLSLLKGIGRDGVEAVATIYAVWNDLLADKKDASDDMICRSVLTDWHPEKANKFKRSDLDHWLGWMRRHGFTPDGTAPRTDHQGSLF